MSGLDCRFKLYTALCVNFDEGGVPLYTQLSDAHDYRLKRNIGQQPQRALLAIFQSHLLCDIVIPHLYIVKLSPFPSLKLNKRRLFILFAVI